jgi:FKBP-type peptidyl-prolyl cis-trans isomerase FklB
MKRSLLTLFALCLLSLDVQAQPGAAPRGTGTAGAAGAVDAGVSDRASYAIGMNWGRAFREDGAKINLEQLVQGLKDGLQGAKPRYTEEQLRTAFETFNREVQAKQQQRFQQVAAKNKQDGEAFLATNRTKAGIKSTASGLQYQVVRSGTGATPKATDSVKVHYEGRFLDGTVFDSSLQRKEPQLLQVDGVIDGWAQALKMMRVGDRWRLFIPPELAYGEDGTPDGAIPPQATLVFDVELLEIPAPAQPARTPTPRSQ